MIIREQKAEGGQGLGGFMGDGLALWSKNRENISRLIGLADLNETEVLTLSSAQW